MKVKRRVIIIAILFLSILMHRYYPDSMHILMNLEF